MAKIEVAEASGAVLDELLTRCLNLSTLWQRDEVQFPRLIAEIVANVEDVNRDGLCESMDLEPDELDELFDRADAAWESAKNDEPRISENWGILGPVMDELAIDSEWDKTLRQWRAIHTPDDAEVHYYIRTFGATRLESIARCIVRVSLGPEAEVDDELVSQSTRAHKP